MEATARSSSSHSAWPKRLEDRIAKSFSYSAFPDGTKSPFIPRANVEDLVTYDSVRTELFGGSSAQSLAPDELINYVTSSAKKLFIISMLSNVTSSDLRKAMEKFKQHDFGDKNLPVLAEDFDNYPRCFEDWGILKKQNFKSGQWQLLVPVFPKEFEKMQLRPEHILPFTYVDSQRKEGTFGDVYQVTIHDSHQELPMRKFDGSLANAALKELKASANGTHKDAKDKAAKVFKEWQAEAQALEDTSRQKHEHIVSVKSIFTKGTRHYFMFQWADGGSLRDLYQEDWRSNLSEVIVQEVVKQLIGLADALSTLHNYQKQEQAKDEIPAETRQSGFLEVPGQNPIDESYRHGDLKPENILRFVDNSSLGVWKIADMGLAKHHLAATALRGPTTTLNATPSYEPPEVYTLPDQGRSRQYDIWSMGCITLELLVWLLYGPEALDDFSRSMNGDTGQVAPYWEFVPGSNKKEARLRENVLKCIARIRADPECQHPTAIRDLLDIVEKRLLIIPLPPGRASEVEPRERVEPQTPNFRDSGPPGSPATSFRVLEPVPGPFRARAETLRDSLEIMQGKGKKDMAYWFTGTKRDGLIGPLADTPKGPELQVRVQHFEFA